MFSKRYGSGQRIFAGFHGWSGDHRTFEPIIRYLPAESSFYSFDLPGIGLSPPPENWSREEIVKLLNEGVSSIQGSSITLIGNCSGAILSLLILKNAELRIGRLVLIDPFAYIPWYLALFLNRYFGKKAYMMTFANSLGRRLTNMALTHRRSGKSDLTSSFKSVNHEAVYNYLRLLASIGKPEQLSGIKIPIDLVYGRKTFHAVKDSIRIWKEIFPEAAVHELSGSGHLPIEEEPKSLSEIIFHDK